MERQTETSSNNGVLFLYTELAGYILTCMESLADEGIPVHVVAYPVNPEAPFAFNLQNSSVRFYDRRNFDSQLLMELIEKISPRLLFCSGWIDPDYVTVSRQSVGKMTRVLVSDNVLGDVKSLLSLLRARMFYRKAYDLAFVPGEPQKRFVRKLGFSDGDIYTGFYTADVKRYRSLVNQNISGSEPFPKRLVFAGRYVEFKGVVELWEAFSEIDSKDWTLHCLGTGPLWDSKKIAPNIVHHGFVQPSEMDSFVSEGGVFILPSHREPWGVVVHEFALAGFPLILSRAVNSGTAFLREPENGIWFEPGNKQNLKEAFKKIFQMPDAELRRMAKNSITFASKITVETWKDRVREMMKKYG